MLGRRGGAVHAQELDDILAAFQEMDADIPAPGGRIAPDLPAPGGRAVPDIPAPGGHAPDIPAPGGHAPDIPDPGGDDVPDFLADLPLMVLEPQPAVKRARHFEPRSWQTAMNASLHRFKQRAHNAETQLEEEKRKNNAMVRGVTALIPASKMLLGT